MRFKATVLFIVLLFLFLTAAVYGQAPLPNAPAPKPPVQHWYKPEFSTLSRLQLMAASYDGATTARNYRQFGYTEADPIAKVFIGRNPSNPRMVLFGAAEVYATALLPKKYRIPAQIALITLHVVAASKNLHY